MDTYCEETAAVVPFQSFRGRKIISHYYLGHFKTVACDSRFEKSIKNSFYRSMRSTLTYHPFLFLLPYFYLAKCHNKQMGTAPRTLQV